MKTTGLPLCAAREEKDLGPPDLSFKGLEKREWGKQVATEKEEEGKNKRESQEEESRRAARDHTGTRMLTSGSETQQASILSGSHFLSTQATPSPVLTPWLMLSCSLRLQNSNHEPEVFLVSSNRLERRVLPEDVLSGEGPLKEKTSGI